MFTELKAAIKIRRRVEGGLAHPDLVELVHQLDEAREIVKTFLLAGRARLHKGWWGNSKVAGWMATKFVHFPGNGDSDQSDRYLIVAVADFPKPVPIKDRVSALNTAIYVLTINGSHYLETKAVLFPTDALYDSRAHQARFQLAYAKEVIEMIRRDPYVGQTTLVPNPKE